MFAINAASNKSASSDSISSMSSMSMSPTLSYIPPNQCPSPKSTTIVFGTAQHVEPLNFKKLKDGELEDEDKSIFITQSFTMERPAPTCTKIDEFSDSHTSREVEALNNAADNAANVSDAASNVSRDVRTGGSPSHVSQQLELLYHSLHSIYGTPQPESTAKKDKKVKPTSKSEDSDDNNNEESWSAWKPSSPAPPQGDATHPPSQWVCGEHPGMGWELNDSFTTTFYSIQIPDPTTNRVIVAPYISYSIQRNRAEVQGTYGKGYPIVTCLLEPIPVNYYCPPITPEQMILLDAKAPFAHVVNKILNDKFPLVISTAVRRYQYYQEGKYLTQNKIRRLQEKENQCLEKAMCVLSNLENTNILGHLACFEDEVYHDLTHNQIAAYEFLKVIHTYQGVITTSALDGAPNPWQKHFVTNLDSGSDSPPVSFTKPCTAAQQRHACQRADTHHIRLPAARDRAGGPRPTERPSEDVRSRSQQPRESGGTPKLVGPPESRGTATPNTNLICRYAITPDQDTAQPRTPWSGDTNTKNP